MNNMPNGWSITNLINYLETEAANEHDRNILFLVIINAITEDRNLKTEKYWWK